VSDRFEREGLSFDDVLLIPAKSDVLPTQVDVSTRLTADIHLNIPLISAAMDMVTEARLAIAMAREGGIGVIHKNMSIEEQALEVDRVNITQDGKLVGILTNRDLRFETDLNKPVGEAMTSTGLVTTREGTTLEEAKRILHEHRIEKLPVVDDNMVLRGLITIKDIEKIQRYPNACKDELGRLRVAAAVGVTEDTIDRAAALAERGVDALVVDTAHGHSMRVLKMIERLKEHVPQVPIIAGNVATAEGCADLIAAGAAAVKVHRRRRTANNGDCRVCACGGRARHLCHRRRRD